MKIALIGTAAGEMEAPFNDESYEIWCMNWNTPKYSRVTLDFEIHETRKGKKVTPKKHGVPTVTQKNFPHKHAKTFPRYLNSNFYKSTLDYMMAYALYLHETKEPVEVVEIYGVFMAIDDDEYFCQQPSLHAWIGYALSKFDVKIHKNSPLMQSNYVYGRADRGSRDKLFNETQFEALKAPHQEAVDQSKAQIEQLKQMIYTHQGCIQAYDRMAKTDRARASGQVITDLTHTAQIRK